jgi:hypothetical protein
MDRHLAQSAHIPGAEDPGCTAFDLVEGVKPPVA